MRIITLTTDYGHSDPFVGVMKGVIASIAPDSAIVDLTHEILPQDVLAGALALESAIDYFPPGTIHLAVVDPGVGSQRRAISVETDRAIFVGPDNGLFTLALRRNPARQIVSVENPKFHLPDVSATFHGRDVFAPVAAHLATGIPLDLLGRSIDRIEELQLTEPRFEVESIQAHTLTFDRFGNVVTDLRRSEFEEWVRRAPHDSVKVVSAGLQIDGIRATYSDVDSGQPVAYFGSGGRLEIGIRDGNVAESLRAGRGTVIEVIRG